MFYIISAYTPVAIKFTNIAINFIHTIIAINIVLLFSIFSLRLLSTPICCLLLRIIVLLKLLINLILLSHKKSFISILKIKIKKFLHFFKI